MGFRLWRSIFVLSWVYFLVIESIGAATICDVPKCNCTVNAASWKTVNCTLYDDQNLKLESFTIPPKADEIFISRGERIFMGPKTFNQLSGLTLLRFDGVRELVMEKQSFLSLTSPSLLIQIQNCDQLSIKTGAFENVQSSIEIEITRCTSVDVEKSAFNKLKSAIFKDVQKMILASGAFEFQNQGSIGRHGPVTTIFFDNVKMTTIPQHTFFSILAEVTIRNSVVRDIRPEAFSATQISSIAMINSEILYIRSNAFLDRTLIFNFKIDNCTINKIETGAVVAAITNFTVQHSRITDVQSGAINGTVARAEISANEIGSIHSSGFVFHNWNKICFEQNMIKFLHSDFMVAPVTTEVAEFTFTGNDIFNFESGALSFVPHLEDRVFTFKNNFFDQTCHCTIEEWIVDLITANVSSKIKQITNNTFCTVNDLLSKCFELKVGVISIHNFTELVCNPHNNTIVCEPYKGETKIVNTTSKMLFGDDEPTKSSWFIIILSIASGLVLIVVVSFTIILIRGSRWLKGKGYFRKIQYNQNEHSNDEENTIETVDESDKLDISEDLTMELLQDLSKKLDDPTTHQEASEMIEQLYQKYIRNSGPENNYHQEDEAHLYEELGNLQLHGGDHDTHRDQNGPRSILRLMEEKFNTQLEDIDADEAGPALVLDYSEPSDAAVHLYSELKQNKDSESESRDSLKSRGSTSMAFRPLPNKPGSSKM